ncbi:MAG: NAD(P) transhydrogenase subunit alpha [Bacteroidales bacterium]|jgi:NAD(P) transhydrogenase subunit alpha|nr:NAD(P) transhydrogenase subunit alpha [Bacteroidales bacterium]MDD4671645.1 NAD(P) transhydrogenase subunit alpha [Bacteroidales bacterium]MDY0349373.1 NAD(P) transhydrogenase subunit alpha [Tenuifilaceae bacterium]
MIIGIPREIMHGEKRVAAIPETVKKMVDGGAKVLFEAGAGAGSHYADEAYKEAGAEIVTDAEDVFSKSDVVLKVKEPQFNADKNKHELDMMHKGQYLITFIHPASPANHEMVKKMAENGVIGLTLDGIPRISRAQSMDALSSMSSCAGYKGMIMAVNDLSKFMPFVTSAVGRLRPATVLVIGAGVAGLRAIATAKGLGATVYSADIRPEANKNAESLGAIIVDTGVPEEIAVSADGKHANKLPEKWLEIERENLKETILKADIIFCSALILGKVAPILVTEEMVKEMQSGSCIVDISIDQGGNCDITTPGEVEVKHDVTIQGIKNIPGMLSTSSTIMFSKNIYNLLNFLIKDGKINLDESDEIVSSILVTKDGEIVHKGTQEAMGLN